MDKCRHKDCYYLRPLDNNKDSSKYCCYLLMTDQKRDCPADKCDKYLPRLEARRLGMKWEELS